MRNNYRTFLLAILFAVFLGKTFAQQCSQIYVTPTGASSALEFGKKVEDEEEEESIENEEWQPE